jgi:tetratricopeptide (TPR) repeat protein
MSYKRFPVILLLTFIALANPVSAQKSKLQQGKDYYIDGSYSKALEMFSQAILQERSLSKEMISEAYYFRGLTYVRLYNEAFTGENKTQQDQFKDALLLAYQDYKKSLEYDNGEQWKKIDLEIKNLHHPILQEGLALLNQYNDLVFNGKGDPKLLTRAEDYLVSAHEIRETYLVCDLLGQVYLDKGQKEQAAEYFQKAEKLYTEQLPQEPDFLMAYVYYRLAAIHKTDSIRVAMQDDQRGLKFLETEHERFVGMKDGLKPERAKQMEEQYQLAMQDLDNLKLDLYLSNPDLYVEAVHVFEAELAQKPGDIDLLIGYASLLERTDKEKAILYYHKALQVDSSNTIALFNIGALYYAKGKELFDAAQKTSDNKQFKILTEEAMTDFETAQPFFEKALSKDPTSLDTIEALKTIAFVLDDQPAYKKYVEMEGAVGK